MDTRSSGLELANPPAGEALVSALRVDAALLLLQHAGLPLPEAPVGSAAWMQALVDALCELSCRDPLTGLANRRQFELTLGQQVGRVARSGESALLLILDIDHFKRVNDAHGHAVGDAVLKQVAAALLECVRPMDTVARIGGEEFAIVLPNCPPSFGPTVAERVRARVEQRPLPLPDGRILEVTISLGAAFAPQWVRSSTSLWMARADQQLYRAKAQGRNRACFEPVATSDVTAEEKGLLFSAPADQDPA